MSYKRKLENAIREHDVLLACMIISKMRVLDSPLGKTGNTLFSLACANGLYLVVEYMIQRGVNIETTNDYGITPLHCAAGHDDVLELLIKHGTNVHAVTKQGETALHQLISCGYSSKPIGMLIGAGINVNVQSKSGRTALHTACLSNNVPIVKLLVDAGANIHLQDEEGRTVLHLGAINSCAQIVKYLISLGANVNAKDATSDTALQVCVRKHDPDPKVVRLLLDAGTDVDNQNAEGDTALHLSIKSNSNNMYQIAKKIINHGANINIKNNNGENSHVLAEKRYNPELRELLHKKFWAAIK